MKLVGSEESLLLTPFSISELGSNLGSDEGFHQTPVPYAEVSGKLRGQKNAFF